MSDSEDDAREEERGLSTTAQKSQNRSQLADEACGRSPEKVQVKRARPNPPLSPSKPINIGSQASAGPSHPSLEEKLPLWVAGASPSKFIALEDVIKINSSLEKMAIVHEIAIDPKFSVEDLQRKDDMYNAVKTNMHNAFWDLLRKDIADDPPNYEHAFVLLKDLKELITEQLVTGNLNNALTAVEEVLDLDHLRNLLSRKVLDFYEVLQMILKILQRLCAPVRDKFVQELKKETNLVNLFRGVFELVEFMKIDMANFALFKNRGTIENYSAQIEREEFMKTLEIDPNGAHFTELWLKRVLVEYQKENSPETSKERALNATEINDILVRFYLTLLEMDPSKTANLPNAFPETFKLDEHRFAALGEKHLQLVVTTAAIFITSNLAGRHVCETTTIKETLKSELVAVLNDVTWRNYVEKLENVYLQCSKNVQKFDERWDDERAQMLKKQIDNLKSADNPIRKIARSRIDEFLRMVLRRSGEQLKLPPGLSVVQSELAAFTSKVYAIVIHNWNTFGTFYAEILQKCIAN